MPWGECLFKGAYKGKLDARLQEYVRSRGFPKWFTMTTSPKGSYREAEVIDFLRKHLEPWREGRDWRILLADDYSAHKSENVWQFCWSRGYILLIHGGGNTPVAQTPDTDLNEHVRRENLQMTAGFRARNQTPMVICNGSHDLGMAQLVCQHLADRGVHLVRRRSASLSNAFNHANELQHEVL